MDLGLVVAALNFVYTGMRRKYGNLALLKTNCGKFMVHKMYNGDFVIRKKVAKNTFRKVVFFRYPMRLNFGYHVWWRLRKIDRNMKIIYSVGHAVCVEE